MLNSSKRRRLARMVDFVEAHGVSLEKQQDQDRMKGLQALIGAQEAVIAHLVELRAQPEAVRIKCCYPPESGRRIFGDAALDLQIAEERRRLQEWGEELRRLQPVAKMP